MSRRALLVVAVALGLHLARGVSLLSSGDFTLGDLYRPYAEGILAGEKPYADLHYEYPPGSLPVLLAPQLVAGPGLAYATAFRAWMLLWDVAILLTLAWFLRRDTRRLVCGVGLYALGTLVLSNLALTRYDLVPAALALWAFALHEGSVRAGRARGAGRAVRLGSAGRFGRLGAPLALGLGTAVKAWPAALLPLLLGRCAAPVRRDGDADPAPGARRFGLSGRAGAVVLWSLPVAASFASVWLVFGDGPWSALAYHARRDLQIEALAATPFLVAGQLGARLDVAFGSGSWNLAGAGPELARGLTTFGLLVPGFLLLAWLFVRRRCDVGLAAVALTGWIVVTAPVLSPQFLLWILPLAAAAAPTRRESLLLLLACPPSWHLLRHYDVAPAPTALFVATLAARNLLLAAWLTLAVRAALRSGAACRENAGAGPASAHR